MLIKSVNWIITDVCNLKCRHCDIWQLPKVRADMTLVDKILNDPVIEKSFEAYGQAFDISLGGGEPFAHPELQDIVDRIHAKYPGTIKSFSTNGVLTKRILRFLKANEDKTFKLNISIDGLEQTHDSVRGVPGAFAKSMRTIRAVKRLYPEQRIEMKMAIMKENAGEISEVYALSRRMGCGFSCKPIDQMDNYTNRNQPSPLGFKDEDVYRIRNQSFEIADDLRRRKEYKKARFTKDIPFHLAGKRKHTSCSVLWEHITVMVNGDIFFCIKEDPGGNIHQEPIEQMSTKPKDFTCKSCMLMCGSFKDYNDAPYTESVANMEATLKCNLTCPMCTQKELQNPGVTMPYERFEEIVQSHTIDHMSFIGGESFMNKDIFRMMGLLDSKGITYELTTNGTLFTAKNKEAVKNCIGLKRMNVSLDGLEKFHDRERGKGAFKKAIKAIEFAGGIFRINIASIVMSDNLSNLVALRKFLNARGIKDQKLIYAMDVSFTAIKESLARIPELKIQGPKCDTQVKDLQELSRLFSELEALSAHVSFEPAVFRNNTVEFIKDKPLGSCKQLDQLRFNPQGERIICEFIRNSHSVELNQKVKEARPAICAHCCKMDESKVSAKTLHILPTKEKTPQLSRTS